jgi:hypothetical protein
LGYRAASNSLTYLPDAAMLRANAGGAAMFRLAAFLLAFLLSAPVFAQVRPINLGPQDNNLFGGIQGLTSLSSASGYESSSYDSRFQKRRRMFEERRAKEQERREKSRKMLAFGKVLTEEELAKAKFNLAHMLWKAGRVDSAKMHLAKILDDYPFTETADRARITLTRF